MPRAVEYQSNYFDYLRSLTGVQLPTAWSLQQDMAGMMAQDEPAQAEFLTRSLLGGKGAHLNKLIAHGFPVPPGFVLTTHAWQLFNQEDYSGLTRLNRNTNRQIGLLETQTGCAFDDPDNPLFVSARSGARESMPGQMSSILNIGLTDTTLPYLIREIGEQNALISYFGLIKDLSVLGAGIDSQQFDDLLGGRTTRDLPILELMTLIQDAKHIYEENTGHEFPSTARQQLDLAIAGVFKSWDSVGARTYRSAHYISDEIGTACTIQQMIWTNCDDGESGAGVLLTDDPNTLSGTPVFSFVESRQGTEVVGDERQEVYTLDRLSDRPMMSQLVAITDALKEAGLSDIPQDVEFSYAHGKVWVLQTRDVSLSTVGKFRYIHLLLQNGRITQEDAEKALSGQDLESLLQPKLDRVAVERAIAENRQLVSALDDAVRIASGVATAPLVYSIEEAKRRGAEKVILFIDKITVAGLNDIPQNVCGLLANNGGLGSHVARVVEGWSSKTNGFGVFGIKKDQLPSEGAEITVDASMDKPTIYSGTIDRDASDSSVLEHHEQEIVMQWKSRRERNPWRALVDDSQYAPLTEKIREVLKERSGYTSHKIAEVLAMNAAIAQHITETAEVYKPDQAEKIKARLKQAIPRGYHTSLRTAFVDATTDEDYSGRSPWKAFRTEAEVDDFFKPDEQGVSEYDRMATGEIGDGQNTYVLDGFIASEFSAGKLEPKHAGEHCAWNLVCTPDGKLILQLIPYTTQLRQMNQAEQEDIISWTLKIGDGWSRNMSKLRHMLDIEAGETNWGKYKETPGERNAEKKNAAFMFYVVMQHLFDYISDDGLLTSMAAIADVFPDSAPPVLEGQMRIRFATATDLEKGVELWCKIYGINADMRS
ncbi:MAG: PEP/pyruvate-binding domain-containing protein [Patescibacteria group bacterium]